MGAGTAALTDGPAWTLEEAMEGTLGLPRVKVDMRPQLHLKGTSMTGYRLERYREVDHFFKREY